MPLRAFNGQLLPVCHTCNGRVFTAAEMRRLSAELEQTWYVAYVSNPRANPTRSLLCVVCLCRVSTPEDSRRRRRRTPSPPPVDLTAAERCEVFRLRQP